jgi:hypothetical protein
MTRFKVGDPCFCYDKDLTKKGGDKNYSKLALTRIVVDESWLETLAMDFSGMGRYYLTESEAKNLLDNWINGKMKHVINNLNNIK